MGGIKTPIQIESNLSWNRLVRQSFKAIPVPESWNAQWKFQIPPVSYPANGFVYLVGVGSDSAPPTWRLGCSVRLASGAVPDSTGEFASAGGLPLRIDDRRSCTLGSYTLLTWPDMNLTDPHLIIEFPHWLQDATIEIFWYDGVYSADFFTKVRESLFEIFGDTVLAGDILGDYLEASINAAMLSHSQQEHAHPNYLKIYDAGQIYLEKSQFDISILRSDTLKTVLDAYLLKTEAAAFVPVETFNQERTFVDAAIQEAKDIADARLAAHRAATNPHNITPQAIGALEEGFRTHDHDEKYAAIDHSHEAIAPTANLQANSLTLNQPLGILGGGTGATTTADALANLGAAAASHTHTGAQISGNIPGNAANVTGVVAIANGGTGASTATAALTNLGAAAINHLHIINQISDLLITGSSITLGNNLKIGWGISDNQWLASSESNTIKKDIDTSNAGFLKSPIYFASLYGNNSHWLTVGATSIYIPTASSFRVYISIPRHGNEYPLTPSLAAQADWKIAWLGIQAI